MRGYLPQFILYSMKKYKSRVRYLRDALKVSESMRLNKMNNKSVRMAMLEHGVPQWKLAKMLGVSENTVWRRLREELPEEEQRRLVKIIEGGESNA